MSIKGVLVRVTGIAIAAAVTGGLGLTSVASANTAKPGTATSASTYPPGATSPVTSFWDTVVVNHTGQGHSWGCVNVKSNLYGHYWLNTKYWGWSYVDARRIYYVGWYANGQSGPYKIVGSQSYPVCGL
jgi:hypothetical protein